MGRMSFGRLLSLKIFSHFSESRSNKFDDDTKFARKTRRCTVFCFRASLVFVRRTTTLVADVPLETNTFLMKKKEKMSED